MQLRAGVLIATLAIYINKYIVYNKILHNISSYWQHTLVDTGCLMWMLLVKIRISFLWWHVHWTIVICVKKQYIMMQKLGPEQVVNF